VINITFSKKYSEEKHYIISVIFQQFLGLEVTILEGDHQDFVIEVENGKQLIVRDMFFARVPDYPGYLSVDYIPEKVVFAKNRFTPEEDIPVIYGTDELVELPEKLVCGIDIFASSFFMLTRWEEYAREIRDRYQRFPASASLAYRFGFLDRPVVNEYVEMLWNMLQHLGVGQRRKIRHFEMMVTHDVDHTQFSNVKQLVRIMGGDLLKRKNPGMAIRKVYEYIQVNRGKQRDPFDTFDYLMDISEKYNLRSRFYFMSGGETIHDNNYSVWSPNTLRIFQRIKDRGHVIGFHPSFNSYNNAALWKLEKERLEQAVGMPVSEGRQHYLRFEVPATWRIWNNERMQLDSTLGYADREGFRCGCCYGYPVFDILERSQMKLIEFPLIVMEDTFVSYQRMNPVKMLNKILFLISKVKKYQGVFVLLWHNSSFHLPMWQNYTRVYEQILDLSCND